MIQESTMTREESRKMTLQAIKKAKTGKEIADAMISHFRAFQTNKMATYEEKKTSPYEDALSILNAPLFGLEK